MPTAERLFPVIFEDDDLLVINKPAGLVCHPTKGDHYSSLISRVRLYLGEGSRPQLVNRLDRETSGVTVVAKNESAAFQLRQLWETRRVQKEYRAIVHGHLQKSQGLIEAPLGKDEHSPVAIKDCVREDGAPARTYYEVEREFLRAEIGLESVGAAMAIHSSPGESFRRFSLLHVVPETGRKHQIRIHLAYVGHPIVGDKLYGGDERLYLAFVERRLTAEQTRCLLLPHHALHASRVQFTWHGNATAFEAEPERWFKEFAK